MSIPDLLQTGKVVAVTGGRRGLGKAIAIAFAEAGADVAICDVVTDDGELEKTARDIQHLGRYALTMKTDVTSGLGVNQFVDQVASELGHIDVLINNAGITGGPDLATLSEEERTRLRERSGTRAALLQCAEDTFDKVMSVHLKGSLLCSQAAGKRMSEQKSGCIINLSSMQAFAKTGSTYNIAKSAIISLTKGLAWELGPHGVRVNAIAPGVIRTEMTRHVWGNPAALQEIINRTPLGRIGEPYDIACAALLLASDASRFITGQTILVDGGLVPIG